MTADIVIDVGCARYGGDYSIERLIEEFQPRLLYGFDPNEDTARAYPEGDTHVMVAKAAAWTHDGAIGYRHPGLGGWITDDPGAPQVLCVDLARVIDELPDDHAIVLKIDAEGAEYELLEHLIATGADRRLALAWVEFHAPDRGRASIERRIGCDLAEWRW